MFISPVKKIDKLHFHKAKAGRPFKVEKMVVIDGMVIAKLDSHRGVWTSWDSVASYGLMPGEWGGKSLTLLKGLVALGVIQEKHLEEHMKRCKELDHLNEITSDRQTLDLLNKKYKTNLIIEELKPFPKPVDEVIKMDFEALKNLE